MRNKNRIYYHLLMITFLLLGVAGCMLASVRMLLGGEVLIFLLAALLPICRKRECLWVVVLTVMVWTPGNLRFAFSYIADIWSGHTEWIFVILNIQTAAILACTEVLIFGMIARLLWKHQKIWEV